ncbi:cupin domain-containing protein [Ruegeria arenilitoris]|uniref:cupin domain-containing protein n=1 Tax=Ruegeria arenilitoris TaxID=1173585 RepID=UPI00147AE345|nr:cupin domain-containing protein [Ruegeria arenilitoris]
MRYSILLEDAEGVSYFEDRDVDLDLKTFAPPAAPFYASDAYDASRFVFLTLPAGWKGVPHRSPKRQLATVLSGTFRVQAGSGEVRDFTAGDLFWAEDVTGTGHASSAEGGEPVNLMVTQF